MGARTLLLIALGCAAACRDESPSCLLATCEDGDATGCQDCVYQGLTSQGQSFEVQVEGGGIKRVYFLAEATTVCSSSGSCPGSIDLCVEIEFDPPGAVCDFPASNCSDCPSTSCNDVSGSVSHPTAQGGLEMSFEFPQGSGCFASVEPDPVTWSALCLPGATPTSCAGSPGSEGIVDVPVPGGRARVQKSGDRPQTIEVLEAY